MFDLSPRTYDIYPMGSGEIVIDAGNRGHRIGVFCYPDGRMQYVTLLDNERQDIRQDGVQNILSICSIVPLINWIPDA